MFKLIVLIAILVVFLGSCNSKNSGLPSSPFTGNFVSVDSTDLYYLYDTILIKTTKQSGRFKIIRRSSMWLKKGNKKVKRQTLVQSWYSEYDDEKRSLIGPTGHPSIIFPNNNTYVTIRENEFNKIN